MKNSTRRKLVWGGIVLVALPTVVLLFFFRHPPEYTSTVLVEVGKPNVFTPVGGPDHATLYGILFLVAIYLPGLALLIAAFISYVSARSASRTQTI